MFINPTYTIISSLLQSTVFQQLQYSYIPMNDSPKQFKEKMIHLRRDFFAYLETHKTKTIPLKKCCLIIEKFFPFNPTLAKIWLEKSNNQRQDNQISWQTLLISLQNQISLQDDVHKLHYNPPSTIDINFHLMNIDEVIKGEKFTEIIQRVKTKETNIIRNIKKVKFLQFQMLAIIMNQEVFFYECGIDKHQTEKKQRIKKIIKFSYLNVRRKMMNNRKMISQKQCSHKTDMIEMFDKVNPISHRTQEFVVGMGFKTRKNTNASEEMKKSLRKSKMESSQCSQISEIKRSITDSSKIPRTKTGFGHHSKLNQAKNRLSSVAMAKIRSNDTKTAFRIMTESSTHNSIDFIKAYKQSHESFQKYIQIQKHKIQKQQDVQIKAAGKQKTKHNYYHDLQQMKQQSIKFQRGRKSNYHQITDQKSSKNYQIRSHSKSTFSGKRSSFHNKLHSQTNLRQESRDPSTDGCKSLEKKQLQIQSLSFCDHYLLVSLMNREIRLYSFRKTIHGFSENLLLQQNYPVLVTDVFLYKSETRKLYNIIIVKIQTDGSTTIHIIQLDERMAIQNQCFQCRINCSPNIRDMIPLGIGGFSENGYTFMVQINSMIRKKQQCLSFQKIIENPDTDGKVSISEMQIHPSFIYLYFGSKKGDVIIYDRFSDMLVNKKKVTRYRITHLLFIKLNEKEELIFWDEGYRMGILNPESLETSSIVSSYSSTPYEIISPFYTDDCLLLFSSREMALVTLAHNDQKEYHSTKAIKLLNRRKKLYQKSHQISPNNEKTLRKILHWFISQNHVVFVCSDYEIIIFDVKFTYIGSFFTLKVENIIECHICAQSKFIAIIYENNQIEIASLYNQEIIFKYCSKQDIYLFFFCGSSVYFCGFLTKTLLNLYIFGFPRNMQLSSQYIGGNQLLFNKSIKQSVGFNLLSQGLSKNRFKVFFYRGNMIWIDLEKGLITFLNKKIYNRCRLFETCKQQKKLSLIEAKQTQNGCISMLRSDMVLLLLDCHQKQIRWKINIQQLIENHGEVGLSHHFSQKTNILAFISQPLNLNESTQDTIYRKLQIIQDLDEQEQRIQRKIKVRVIDNKRMECIDKDGFLLGQNYVYFNQDNKAVIGIQGPDIPIPEQQLISLQKLS